MICPNCGVNIKDNKVECPYCKCDIHMALFNKKQDEIVLHNRLLQIDKFFKIEVNYDFEKLSLMEIERYYDSLIQDYNQHVNELEPSKKEEIQKHIEDVHEETQSRYPIRKSALYIGQSQTFKTQYEVVKFLLEGCNPPQVNAAAFKLRGACERNLQDLYKFRYIDTKDVHKFAQPYYKMFGKITKNVKETDFLTNAHFNLNLFVHESKRNDLLLRKKFKTDKEIINYLQKVLELHAKYKLI